MQLTNNQLSPRRALVKPHSGCASISFHTPRRAKDLIRAKPKTARHTFMEDEHLADRICAFLDYAAQG
jgi:hypothetical protein